MDNDSMNSYHYRYEPVYSQCDYDVLKNRIVALEANNVRLRDHLAVIAGEAAEFSRRHGAVDLPWMSKAFSLIGETPADSLAAVRREAMEEMRKSCISILDQIANQIDEDIADGGDIEQSIGVGVARDAIALIKGVKIDD